MNLGQRKNVKEEEKSKIDLGTKIDLKKLQYFVKKNVIYQGNLR